MRGQGELLDHRYQRGLGRCHGSAGAMRSIVSGLVLGLSASGGQACDIDFGQFAPPQPVYAEASPLPRTWDVAYATREKSGTGFFVDDAGHMLTARHVAEDCVGLTVAKEGRA